MKKRRRSKKKINQELFAGLLAAATRGDLPGVQVLIPYVGPNIIDNLGRTPLHLAARSGNVDLVRFLIESGADPSVVDNNDSSVLHYAVAAREVNPNVVRYLVERIGLNPADRNRFGDTPLHFAARNGNLNLVRYLVEKRHVDPNPVDLDGKTPLDYAGDPRVFKYLRDIPPPPSPSKPPLFFLNPRTGELERYKRPERRYSI